jgi:hypothetical protein
MTEVHHVQQGQSGALDDCDSASLATAQLEVTALIEQAKGVLMTRYDIDAACAAELLLVWSAEQQVTPAIVADVLVNEICQGREPTSEPQLVRWLEQCLRSLP